MLRATAHALGLSLLLVACGPSTPKSQDSKGNPGAIDAGETPEDKFLRQTADTVAKMCIRLVDCSIEDAKRELPPEKLAELRLEEVAPQAIEDCTQEYTAMSLSPRQVIGIRDCLGAATECPVYNECLIQATAPQ